MYVHNLMEEVVISRVNDLFEAVKSENPAWFTCSCEQCRVDTVCYVLNRVSPKYIVSSHGVVFTQKETFEENQNVVDLDKIIVDGMKQVLSEQRPHSSVAIKENTSLAEFYFPTIIGNVINGKTFEPLSNIEVSLLIQKEPVAMMNTTWHNPYKILPFAPGTFTFWPASFQSEKVGETRLFSLEAKISAPGFEAVSHFFDLHLKSEQKKNIAFNAENMYKIQDLYIFPENEE